MKLDDYPDVLTIDDVRAIFQIGRDLAYSAIRSGQIPSFKMGRNIRVYKSAVKEMLDGTTQGAGLHTPANSR